MNTITMRQLLGMYAAEPWSPAELASGEHLISAWNSLGAAAEAEGVPMVINPATASHIGGTGNGGARPKGSTIGAKGSKHQLLMALDWFDPTRAFMRWLLSYGLEKAGALGMYFEHPQWTHSWVHGQIVAPGDGFQRWNIFFIPYADLAANPATCAALPEQRFANVIEFPFNTMPKVQP
jgi:hypothetical protein